jgi:cytochrome c-type biogenesis protein CcmH
MKRTYFWTTSKAFGRNIVLTATLATASFVASAALAQVFSPEVRTASDAFVCQCGCNHQLSACGMLNCGSATPLRTEIQEHLKQGKTQQEIVQAFVAKYGKVILAAPTTQGFDLAAWLTPFAALVFGLILIYFVIKAWTHRKPALAGAPSVPAIPDTYRDKIEKELKDLG